MMVVLKNSLMGICIRCAVALLIFCAPSLAASKKEPWYTDVSIGHWAKTYIRTLWEEGIADGYADKYLRWSYFYPDRQVSRAEFTMLAAKAFQLEPYEKEQPSFMDVPEYYAAYDWKRAYPYIEAAYRKGMIYGDGNRLFLPDNPLRREEAVAILVRSLGLKPYFESLSAREVEQALSRFRDSQWVSAPFKQAMAAAVNLRIVEGYPDGNLLPVQNITRAEAATIIYRSCLMLLDASPNPFSPDGDSIDDTTSISILTLKNRNILDWNLFITDYSGKPIVSLKTGWIDRPPPAVTWNGTNQSGHLLPPGTYYYSGWVVDNQQQLHRSAMKPITLEFRKLWASLAPEEVPPGGRIKITAFTTGRATSVTAIASRGERIPLTPRLLVPAESDVWDGELAVGAEVVEGAYQLKLVATYVNTSRQCVLEYRVAKPANKPDQLVGEPLEQIQFIISD